VIPAAISHALTRPFTLVVIAGIVIAAVLVARLPRRMAADAYKRGAVVLTSARGRRAGRGTARMPGALTLGGVVLPFLDETKHFKIIGATGSGKSTAIRELLGGALARGDRAIIADPDGGYRDRFFSRYRGDRVLNPFEPQALRWEPFAEIDEPYDVEHLSSGLIPSGGDAAANEWRGYARTFLAELLRRCRFGPDPCTEELWRLLAVAPVEELRPLLADTPAMPFLDAENARMFGSIRSVAVSAVTALQYVQAQRAAPLSVRDWVRTARSGALFIPYKAGQIAALRAMIATWMRLAIVEAMNGEDSRDQRLWFIVDELDALGAIEGLKDALARLRKFGGRCVLGFQSIAQVSGQYGNAEAQTIVENCGNSLILRCAGSENGGTSAFASKLIGEREVVRRQTTRGRDREAFWGHGARRSVNVGETHVTEAAVLASEIETLPDLCGYLKPASSAGWHRIRLQTGRRQAAPFGP
jgi:type IV secretory pathway TraG/TraD family ATPase VirD4